MDIIDIVLSKKYTDESLKGIAGALAGKNCTIKSATKTDGVTTVVFAWTADDGTEKTTTIQVNDGVDGKDTSQDAVLFTEQTLNDSQRAQARENIGAADAARQNILVGSEIGNPIVVDDAFSAPLYDLTLYGKSTQEGTTGAQLFDVSEVSTETWLNSEAPIEEKAVGYWTSGYIPVKTGNYICSPKGSARGWTYDADKNGLRYIANSGGSPISIKEGEAFIRVTGANTADPQNFMFNEGNSIKPYEPYTGGKPSPSTSYPQEIESVGQDGEIGVEVLGGNLFDKSAAYDLAKSGGWSASFDGEEIKVVGNNVTIGSIRLFRYKKTLPAGTYTFSISKPLPFKIRIDNYFLIQKGETSATVTFDNGVSISHFAVGAELGTTFNEQRFKIMLNAGSTALPYELYKPAQTLIIPTPNGLPGIRVSSGGNYTDADGQQWVCDEVDLKKGVYVRRIGKKTITSKDAFFKSGLSTDDVNCFGLNNFFVHIGTRGEKDVLMSNCFVAGIYQNFGVLGEIFLGSASGNVIYFSVDAQKYPDTETFKQWAVENGLMFLYQLADIIETPLAAEELSQLKTLRTYSPTTTVINDADAGMQLGYQRDVNISIKKLEDAIASMTTT